MALSEVEKQSLLELKEQGYTFSEAMGFIASNRLGKRSRVGESIFKKPAQNEGRFDDVGEDLVSGAKEIVQNVRDRGNRQTEINTAAFRGEQSAPETIIQTGLNIAGTALDPLFTAGKTVAKLFTKESTEQNVAGAIQEVGQRTGVTDAYQNLSPRTRRNVDAGLDALDVAGVGTTKAITGPVKSALKNSFKTGIKSIDEAAAPLVQAGVTETGAAGISLAEKAGLDPASLMQRAARIPKSKQAKFEEMAGQSVGQYLVDRQFFGRPDQIVDQLYSHMSASKGRLDEALAAVPTPYKNPSVEKALEMLAERESKIGFPGAETQRIAELQNKYQTSGLSLSEINEVKRLLERNVRLPYKLEQNTAMAEGAIRVDSGLRSLIETKAAENGITVIRELNKETQLARQLADDLGIEFSGSAGNNAITITDWILLAEAAGNPTAAAAFFGKKLFGSQQALSATAQLLSRNKQYKSLPEVDVAGIQQTFDERLALPAPAIQVGSAGNRVDVPSGARLAEPVKEVGRSPQTGKFIRVYTSSAKPAIAASLAGGTYYAFTEDADGLALVGVAGTLNPQARKLAIKELREARRLLNKRKAGASTSMGRDLDRAREAIDQEIAKLESQ